MGLCENFTIILSDERRNTCYFRSLDQFDPTTLHPTPDR